MCDFQKSIFFVNTSNAFDIGNLIQQLKYK
jgi:hypothetical protein